MLNHSPFRIIIFKFIFLICQVDYEDKTPLHFAAANGNGDVVKLLVDNKADVSLQVSYRVVSLPAKKNELYVYAF